MKTTAIFAFFISLFIMGCNSNRENRSETKTIPDTHAMHQENTSQRTDPMAWESKIQLDKGRQWKANKETTDGVQNMLVMLKDSSSDSIESYRQLGDDLAEELNILISECTMEGSSHDNLHIYLKPLIVNIAQLKEAASKEEGEKISSEIEMHLQAYPRYFI